MGIGGTPIVQLDLDEPAGKFLLKSLPHMIDTELKQTEFHL
jgi:hypothetical protein